MAAGKHSMVSLFPIFRGQGSAAEQASLRSSLAEGMMKEKKKRRRGWREIQREREGGESEA